MERSRKALSTDSPVDASILKSHPNAYNPQEFFEFLWSDCWGLVYISFFFFKEKVITWAQNVFSSIPITVV